MEPPPRLQLFGLPALAGNGQSLALPFERRSQLLVLLALRRAWVGRAEVAALLWPDQGSPQAYTNLRKILFRLPSLPWGHLVQSQGSALRFEGETDVSLFDAALHEQRLEAALSLRRGELLSGFDDHANEAWTSWLAYERERLRGVWRSAAMAWLAGDVPGPRAVELSGQLLEADPFDEESLRMHLAWLQRTGQGAAARLVHGRYMARLADELGLAPSAALQAVGASLQGPAGPASAAAAPSKAAPSAAAAADAATRPILIGPGSDAALDAGFIGRSAELRHIASLLEQDDCRLVNLLGPGGVGKTRLARRALQELAPGFAQGTLFVALEDAAHDDAAGDALARALGVRPDDQSSSLASAVAALRGKHLLLALDNLETVHGAAGLVQRLLRDCAHLKLLVTSRVRLALADEWVFVVEGLPCPDREDADRVDAFDAARLFTRSARRVQPDFLLASEAAAVADICRAVAGMPLALELAAAWVRVLSCREIAEELRAGTELLHAPDPSHAPRHASLEQVFDQSWQRLSETERSALGRLSLCRGGFDTAAARAVAGASLAVLAALADKSLLHKDGARLSLHPLVQQLAAARLPVEVRAAAAQAHAAHFLQLLVRSRQAMEHGNRAALDQVDLEGANARAAWRWAATEGAAATADSAAARAQAVMLAQAAQALLAHADHRGSQQAGLALGQWAADSGAAHRHPGLRAMLLALCAHLQYRLNRFEAAEHSAQAALDLVDDSERLGARLQALRVLGGCHLRLGRLGAAREHYEQALRLASEGSDLRAAAALLSNLALVEKRLGRFAESAHLARQALQQLRLLDSVADVARCLNNLGDLAMIMAELDQAEAYLNEGLALCEQHGIRGTQGLLLANQLSLKLRRGRLDDALRLGDRALAVLRQIGDRGIAVVAQQDMATVELRRGRPAAAEEMLSASMREALQIGAPDLQLYGLLVAADLLAARDGGAAAAVFDFVRTHQAADAPLRQEAAARQPVPARTEAALLWPADLTLQGAAELVAGDAAAPVDRLLKRLRRAA